MPTILLRACSVIVFGLISVGTISAQTAAPDAAELTKRRVEGDRNAHQLRVR